MGADTVPSNEPIMTFFRKVQGSGKVGSNRTGDLELGFSNHFFETATNWGEELTLYGRLLIRSL